MSQQDMAHSVPVTIANDQSRVLAGLSRNDVGLDSNLNGAAFLNQEVTPVGVALWTWAIQLVGNLSGIRIARTPDTFKSVSANALGNTAIWTPAAGKKFRLMRFAFILTENATLAVAGTENVSFQDNAAATGISFPLYIPAAAIAGLGGLVSPWYDLGNGYLSAAANNPLNVNLSVALATGSIGMFVCGTEE